MQSATQALFNKRAASWDQSHTQDPDKIRLMLALCDIGEGMELLDVGCGTGVLEPFLLSHNPRHILAVDFAENMIAQARQKNMDSRVEFRCADIYAVSDYQCDHCFLYNAYPHFEDPEALFAHLSTLIRPGGRLTISHARGKSGDVYKGQTLCGVPVHPNQAILGRMRPYFHVDATIDNNALFLISGLLRDPL